MPTADEMKLQKERIRLAEMGQIIFGIQKKIEEHERKIQKLQNQLEKQTQKAQKIKERIQDLEKKPGLLNGDEVPAIDIQPDQPKKLKKKKLKELPAPKE